MHVQLKWQINQIDGFESWRHIYIPFIVSKRQKVRDSDLNESSLALTK